MDNEDYEHLVRLEQEIEDLRQDYKLGAPYGFWKRVSLMVTSLLIYTVIVITFSAFVSWIKTL